MNHNTADRARSHDGLTAQRGDDLQDAISSHGGVLLERFQPPPLEERVREAQAMSVHELVRRAHELQPYAASDRWARPVDLAHLRAWDQEYLVERLTVPNLITQIGDQYYGERASGISSPPGQVTGMQLGTGSTAVAKTGGGSGIGTYKSGSDKAIDGGFPTSALSGSSRRIQWKSSWGAGVVNGSALAEIALVTRVLDGSVATTAQTVSRALFGPMTLGSLDTLAATWNHDLLGA